MIKTDIKERYIEAIKDIRSTLLGPLHVNLVAFLANEGVPTYLRRWALPGSNFMTDIRSDFQRILTGLDKAIEVHPADPWLRVMRGRALTALGYFMAAIQDLDAALGADSAERCLFLAEAYFEQAKGTFNDPLAYYTSAALYATKSIRFHTKEHNSPRPYLVRAQCDAHILKLCGYHHKTALFHDKYRDIEADLRAARDVSGEAEITRIAKNIRSLLGVEES